jgi:methionyl-tRNA formyltransferase
MIENNKFYLENLKNIIFFGYSDKIEDLININKRLGINSNIITGSDQSKLIKKKIKVKIFNKLDNKFQKYIHRNFKIEATLFISLGARYIFKNDLINFFKNNLINFHGTRLPYDSGGGGFSWKILREDRIDNQLVHVVDETIDGGPIILNEVNIFPKSCQIPIDFEKYRLTKFTKFYEKFIFKILNKKKFILKNQVDYIGRYNPRLNTDREALIDWNLNSYDLINFINAFDEPYVGASTFINNGNFGRVYIKGAHLHGGDSSNHPFMSGIVTRKDKNWLVVSTTGKHMLLIEKVLNSKNQNIISKIKLGDRFYNKLNKINKSKSKKTKYGTKGIIS